MAKTEQPNAAQPMKFSRRAALQTLGATAGAVAVWPYLSDSAAEAFAAIQTTGAPPKLAFLSAAQYAAVDAVAETIIPADDHSPGARAARVADYIDLLLAAGLRPPGLALRAKYVQLRQGYLQRNRSASPGARQTSLNPCRLCGGRSSSGLLIRDI